MSHLFKKRSVQCGSSKDGEFASADAIAIKDIVVAQAKYLLIKLPLFQNKMISTFGFRLSLIFYQVRFLINANFCYSMKVL